MPSYQILTNDDGVCIPSLSSILIAVKGLERHHNFHSLTYLGIHSLTTRQCSPSL